MERVKSSKLAHYAEKFAVESEPGLTTTQLLLTNGNYLPSAEHPAHHLT